MDVEQGGLLRRLRGAPASGLHATVEGSHSAAAAGEVVEMPVAVQAATPATEASPAIPDAALSAEMVKLREQELERLAADMSARRAELERVLQLRRKEAEERIATSERLERKAIERRREELDRWMAEQQRLFAERIEAAHHEEMRVFRERAEAALNEQMVARRREEAARLDEWRASERERIEAELAAEQQRFSERLAHQVEEFERQLGQRQREQEERMTRWWRETGEVARRVADAVIEEGLKPDPAAAA